MVTLRNNASLYGNSVMLAYDLLPSTLSNPRFFWLLDPADVFSQFGSSLGWIKISFMETSLGCLKA